MKKNCIICGNSLPTVRHQSYCSTSCRNKKYNQKYKTYHKEWQRKKRGEFVLGKLQCLFCNKWYVQVASHVIQHHKLQAQKYKEYFDLPLSYGVIPRWYKELKGKIALNNSTYKNLEKGAKNRYTKGDLRAKQVTGWKGRKGNKGFGYY